MTDDTIFAAALEQPDPAARVAYLDTVCGEDTAQRKRIDSLLTAHDKAGTFLERPAVAAPNPSTAPTRAFRDPAKATGDDTATRAYGGVTEDDAQDALGFLEPTGRPDSLGRIGHYEVLEVLGHGGFGIVYRAFDDVLQRVVAVKVLAPSLATTSPARKRFVREARAAGAVQHENIVRIHAIEEQPLPHIVMEFIPGETLQQRLDRNGPLDNAEIVRIGRQVAEGLAAAHANGLIHRDIKPSNILVDAGPDARVKITDFGLARAADDASLTRSGTVAGTPMYMAPEQAKGETLDHRADLFSLGSVLYVMCTGRPPFRASSTLAVLKRVAEEDPRPIREVIPEVPEWICRIVEKLHAKNPTERYQSAKEVADVLADCERQLAVHKELKDTSRIPEAKPKPRTQRLRALVSFGVPLMLLALMSFLVLGGPFTILYPLNQGRVTLVGAPDPDFEKMLVRQNGELVATLDPTNPQVKLPPGDYELEAVCVEGYEATKFHVESRLLISGGGSFERVEGRPAIRLTLRRGESTTVAATVEKRAILRPSAAGDGWVSLFNGKDLNGWNRHPRQPGNWRIEEGSLVGSGPEAVSHLFSDRDDYENFHLRVEARVNFRGKTGLYFGNSGIYFRAAKDLVLQGRYPAGYEAQIFAGEATPLLPGRERNRTGSLYGLKPYEQIVPGADAGEWFTMEVIATGPRITIKVNGVTTVDGFEDTTYRRGHLALQQVGPETIVQFRKIEIKELPASPPPDEQWVSLFNGKDLTGWAPSPHSPGRWRVEGGELVGTRGPGYLFAAKSYENFHLRAEVRVNAAGNGGIAFRRAFQVEIFDDPECPTGTLLQVAPDKTTPLARYPSASPVDAWFTLEIRADGPALAVRIGDGPWITAQDTRAEGTRSGPLQLEVFGPNTVVQFRKIEIVELSAAPLPAMTALDREDLNKLQGEWLVRVAELDGKALPPDEVRELSLRLSEQTFDFRAKNKPIEDFSGTFRVDAAKKHLLLDTPGQKVPVRVGYRFEGDRLRLNFAGLLDTDRLNDPPLRVSERTNSRNNIFQLAFAMHAYADTHKALPPAAITNPKTKDGKPLLSWRVAILPYIEQMGLYKEFNLEEPWDSEHNKKLIAKMPKVFAAPGIKTTEAFMTHYRVFVGPGTVFEPRPNREHGFAFNEIVDGTSGTILIVEATDPVIWTKPDDLPFDPKKPLSKLGVYERAANVVFCDGRVVSLSRDVTDEVLRGLITRNGGEAVSAPILDPSPLQARPLHLELQRRGSLPTGAVLLKAFDPAKDKAVPMRGDASKIVRVENGAWRIENDNQMGNFRVALGTITEGIPEDGILICRCKVKLQPKHKDAWGDLELNAASPSFHGYDWPGHLSRYQGEMTEWAEKEVRYPVEIIRKKNPPTITVHVGLHADGVLWVKDVELLHIAAPPKPPAKPKPPAPPLVIAPFDGGKAKEYQDAWAAHLGGPVEIENSVGMKLRLVPPGKFTMGSTQKEIDDLLVDAKETEKFLIHAEGPRRAVQVTSPFYLGRYEVTQTEYFRVMGVNPSDFALSGKAAAKIKGIDTDRLPVEMVTWEDAEAFCRKLSARPEEVAAGRSYRLPTEAEWEYACRAGTESPFHTGEWLAGTQANIDLAIGRPRPVGSFPGNAFGLHDMHGNVFEWCRDWFADSYRELPVADPQGPDSGDARVVRGGNYGYKDRYCRSASRDRFQPIARRGGIGFRVVVVIAPNPQPPAKAPPVPAVVQPLRDVVAAKTLTLQTTKLRYEVGVASKIDILSAEADLTESRIKLAEEEGDAAAVVARFEDLVKFRQEERDLIAVRVEAGADRRDVLNQADARLGDAKARLAKIKPPPEAAPEPRRKP